MINTEKYNSLSNEIENSNEEIVDKVVSIDIDKIKVNKNNFYDANFNIDQLAEEIKVNGQLEPLIITKDYKLISGHRRFAAIKVNGSDKVICRFLDRDLTEDEEILNLIQANSYRTKTAKEIKEEVLKLKQIYKRLKETKTEYKDININVLISENVGKSLRQVQRIIKEDKEKTAYVAKTKQDKFNSLILKVNKMIDDDVNEELQLDNKLVVEIKNHIRENEQLEMI